jgi:hypothetical protein
MESLGSQYSYPGKLEKDDSEYWEEEIPKDKVVHVSNLNWYEVLPEEGVVHQSRIKASRNIFNLNLDFHINGKDYNIDIGGDADDYWIECIKEYDPRPDAQILYYLNEKEFEELENILNYDDKFIEAVHDAFVNRSCMGE